MGEKITFQCQLCDTDHTVTRLDSFPDSRLTYQQVENLQDGDRIAGIQCLPGTTTTDADGRLVRDLNQLVTDRVFIATDDTIKRIQYHDEIDGWGVAETFDRATNHDPQTAVNRYADGWYTDVEDTTFYCEAPTCDDPHDATVLQSFPMEVLPTTAPARLQAHPAVSVANHAGRTTPTASGAIPDDDRTDLIAFAVDGTAMKARFIATVGWAVEDEAAVESQAEAEATIQSWLQQYEGRGMTATP